MVSRKEKKSIAFRSFGLVLVILLVQGYSICLGQGSVTIRWNRVTHDTSGQFEATPLYYNIYCDTIPAFTAGGDNFLVATTDTEYVHTDPRLADPSKNLFYIVRAVDVWGNQSANSDTVGETGFVLARIKIWLQTPYCADGDTMIAAFDNSALISLHSPYSAAARSVTQMPMGVTDWIWVQVRDVSTGAVLAQKSFLLKKNGHITECDGVNEQLGITGVNAGDFQLVVRHRNHVAVMARSSLQLRKTAASIYDFTADSTAYFGGNAAKELQPSVWGMWAGDINQDGIASDSDCDIWRLAAQAGRTGYRAEDLNFDAMVTTLDYVIWFRSQLAGACSKIP